MVRQKPRKAGMGFTLVELILVLAILAMMATVAVPRMGWATLDKVQVKTTAQEFANNLRLTRSLAVTHPEKPANQQYKIAWQPEFGPYTYYEITDPENMVIVGEPISIPAGVTYTGQEAWKFTSLGHSPVGTITGQFTAQGDTVTVTVSPLGRITVQ